jgi:hypothetical protein
MLSVMILMTAAQAVQPATLPRVDGSRIRSGSSCYVIERGGNPIGTTFQSVQRARAGRIPAWRIVVHQRAGGGRFELRDEFLVRRSDLRPIGLNSRRGTRSAGSGWHDIQVAYTPRAITGTRAQPTGVQPINVPLDQPVWEGNLWGITFAALPLRQGSRFRLPFWQYDKGFGAFLVNVTGSQSVETPAGKVDAWVLEAGDDPARLMRYLIAKKTGAELGYSAGDMQQRLGGDCRGMG